jgi:hypothetical protein
MGIRLRSGVLVPLLSGFACALGACGTSSDEVAPGSDASVGDDGSMAGGDGSRGSADATGESASGSGGTVRDAGKDGAGSSSGATDSGSGVLADGGAKPDGGADGGRPDSGASSGSSGGGDASTVPATFDVLQHHKNATRDGVYADALMTKAYAATLTLDAAFAPALNGDVYAQPLYVTDGPHRGQEAFVVATETNHVTAIDGTGAVIWDMPFGTAATATNLPCGSINPLGITGTPVIDMTARAIYFDSMMVPAGATMAKHLIHAISLDTGAELAGGWPVDPNASVPGFNSFAQHQHGALALVNGVVYVPYGGHNGDCNQAPNQYHGWVVGVNAANPAAVVGFSVGTLGLGTATQGGIWATGGVASDGTSLFVATGNTDAPTVWSGGEAVLRLGAGPVFSNQAANEFHMTDWVAADGADSDLGGANPVVFDFTPAGGAVQHLIASLGKDGFMYLLNRDNLNGAGGSLSKTAIAPQGTTFVGALNGAPAVYTTSQGTYIAYRINSGPGTGCPSGGGSRSVGVARITGNPPAPTVVWCSAETGLGSPMVTASATGDVIVWNANNHLFGYDGDTGVKVFDGTSAPMASSIDHFNAPIDTNGRMVVATIAPGHLYVFKP